MSKHKCWETLQRTFIGTEPAAHGDEEFVTNAASQSCHKTKETYSAVFLTNLHFLILIFFSLVLFPIVLLPHHFPPSPIIRCHFWISIKSCFHASSSSPGFNCTPRSSILHHRAWDSSTSLTAVLVQQQFCLCPGTPLICVSIEDTVCKQLQVLLAPRFCI